MRPYYILLFGSLLSLILIHSAAADNDGNDSFEDAERMVEDSFSGTLNSTSDREDWYIIEIPPYTDVAITVELVGAYEDDHITLKLYLEKGVEEASNEISLSRSLTKDDTFFENDDSNFIDLHISLMGEGAYEMEYRFERDLSEGLCGSSFLFMIPLLIVAIILIRSR
jgi:hypothetical protein